ncbi:hypothetical protein DFH27DRAFT_370894 [Peziza echinospora]|nr:hypothetical protein DFH27DRAFT_370894 [Peziza echinospora]
MPSPRRQKYLVLSVLAIVLLTIYFISSTRASHNRTRYIDTLRSMHMKEIKINRAQSVLREAEAQAKAGINERLGRGKAKSLEREKERKRLEDLKAKEAEEHLIEQRKKASAGKKAVDGQEVVGSRKDGKSEDPASPPKHVGKEDSPGAEEKEKESKKAPTPNTGAKTKDITDLLTGGDSLLDSPPPPKADAVTEDTATDYDPKADLTALLRVAPVLVFSKTTCPYSKAAKAILLQKLRITPPPHVVELDQHPHGRALQTFLKDKTGRGTVPNIFVRGKSIGGSDELSALWEAGDLEALLVKMGGKRVTVERA